MATRSLLADFNCNDLVNFAQISGTGATIAGREPHLAIDQRMHHSWESPTAGPHTLTIDHFSTYLSTLGPQIIVLCAHPDHDFTGTVTVRLRNSPAGADVWTSSVSYRPPAGFSDRRIFVVPGTTNARYLQVVLDSGNRLSYVAKYRALDVTTLADDATTLRPIDAIVTQELAAGGFVWETQKAVSPGRRIKRDVRLPAVPSSTFSRLCKMYGRFGRSEPLLWVPDAESDTAQPARIEYMHATSVFGQFDSDFAFSFVGNGIAVDDLGVTMNGPLRSGTLVIESWP